MSFTNAVRGPYCKLQTDFFAHRFMVQARSARAIIRWEKTRIRNLQYRPRKRGQWRFILSLICLTGS